MTLSRTRIPAHYALLAALAVLAPGCKPSESGNIPCQDDGNCPKDYPQCLRAGTAAAHCTEAVVGTPVLASTAIAVSPATITGGTTPSLSLPLPALTSPLASAASVSLTFSGCGSGALTKADGSPVGVGDLGTTITVASPSSIATDNKTCTYTLTVANSAA